MKAPVMKHVREGFLILVSLSAVGSVSADPRGSITRNENAIPFAGQLIAKEHFIADGKGAWNEHKPSADQENEFIRRHGFGEYAKWHLGIDPRFAENTKRRYKFPYGDFTNVHRCGLLAVKARARQYGYTAIENAASKLERAVKDKATDQHRFRNSSASDPHKSVVLTPPSG
jgi:hypothetical protein